MSSRSRRTTRAPTPSGNSSTTLRAELIADLEANGLDDLVPIVDTNLFWMSRRSPALGSGSQARSVRMLFLGQETAVFIGPPGVATP